MTKGRYVVHGPVGDPEGEQPNVLLSMLKNIPLDKYLWKIQGSKSFSDSGRTWWVAKEIFARASLSFWAVRKFEKRKVILV